MITSHTIPTIPIPLVDGDTFFCDNSFFEQIITCHRQAEYYGMHKRESAGTRIPLIFGGIIHKALEYRYKQPDINDLDSIQKGQIEILDQEFAKVEVPDGDHRNFSYAVEMIQAYNLEYRFEDFEVVTCEFPFAMPLLTLDDLVADVLTYDPELGQGPKDATAKRIERINIVWTGKVDLVYKRDGIVNVLDHKTTSMLGGSYFDEYALSSAMQGYTKAAEAYLGVEVNGYTISALATRKITRTGKGITFERQSFDLPDWKRVEWQQDITFQLRRFFQNVLSNYTPKGIKWCSGKYGKCSYFDVCNMSPGIHRGRYLASGHFQDVTWDPTKEDEG